MSDGPELSVSSFDRGAVDLLLGWFPPRAPRSQSGATAKGADKLRAKGKDVDFDELLKMEPDSGTTNIRCTESRHWWPWLGPDNRCLVPFTAFKEPDQVERGPSAWFALSEDRPVAFFAGVWTLTPACGRSAKAGKRSRRSAF